MNALLHARLRPFLPAFLLSVATLGYGFGVGGAFGAAEESIKGALQARADAVLEAKYGGDPAKAKPVVEKAWAYQKRAHLHAGGLGASSLVLALLLALAVGPTLPARVAAIALGAGGLGYSLFWMIAGFLAPTLGGTGAAKESLSFLAIPSAGALLTGTLATFVLVARALLGAPPPERS